MLRASRFIVAPAMALALALALPLAANAESIVGTVTDPAGFPVRQARVSLTEAGAIVGTDSRGRFELKAVPPLILEVSHPDFVGRRLDIDSMPEGPLEIVLEPKGGVVRESIAVSASRGQSSFSPQSAASAILTPEASTLSPNTVLEMLALSPGVSQNGQGGLFQTLSVRGVARQRILTLVEGMRIVSERRAGASASLIDPQLLESVEVVRGPTSTYWGSGALGGAVQLFARAFRGYSVTSGFSSSGDARFVRAGYGVGSADSGGAGWSLGVAVREAGTARTPGGAPLSSAFKQASATLARSWSGRRTTYRALVLASGGRDIGKASTDFPDRVTTYPAESHGLLRLSADHDGGWRFGVWGHPNELETRVESAGGESSTVTNRAFDWGIDLQREQRRSSSRTLRWGLDLFARDGVRSRESERDALGRVVLEQNTLADASERELGLYGAIEAGFSRGRSLGGDRAPTKRRGALLAGGRLTLQSQHNPGFGSVEDSAITGFVGVVFPLARGLELTGNLGTGLRFPSISERFFSGTTGRGTVTGNADLAPEESASAELGWRWTGAKVFVAGSLFRNEIEDYIERVETAVDRLTFVNLNSGRIQGVEIDGAWQATAAVSFSFGGHAMSGRADDGRPLADIPAERLFGAWAFEADRWTARARWERRLPKFDFGSGEKATPESDLVSFAVERRWRSDWSFGLSASNLLDEEYFNSADEKVPLSPGRSLGLSLEWSPSLREPANL